MNTWLLAGRAMVLDNVSRAIIQQVATHDSFMFVVIYRILMILEAYNHKQCSKRDYDE